MILAYANESTATKRRVFFQLVDATDGITPETGEDGGQPQVSTNGGAWTDTGIGTLVAIGNGRYYAVVTQTLIATAGVVIETRYKSAATAECPGDSMQVVAFDPYDAASLGLSRIDAAVSSRSTYAGADTSGTTTLLTRLPDTISLAALNAQMDTALADYDGPTQAEMTAAFTQIKGAGWDSETDTLEDIAAASSAEDIAAQVWAVLTSGDPVAGSVLELIIGKLNLITNTGIVLSSIVASGEVLDIWKGRSRTIVFVMPQATKDLTDHTPKFGMTRVVDGTGTLSLEVVGTLEEVGDDYHLTFELTTAQTALFELSPTVTNPYRVNAAESYSYHWSISATDDAASCPQLAEGMANVKKSDTTCATS